MLYQVKSEQIRVKDRMKNGASKRAGLALVPFFAWPKPKILFLGLSLLRNNKETLATQAKSLWFLWSFNPCCHYCCCGPCGRGSCGHCGPCVNWITLYLLSLENFVPKCEAINNEDLIKIIGTKIRGRWRQWKRRWKSEFAFFQSSSWLLFKSLTLLESLRLKS